MLGEAYAYHRKDLQAHPQDFGEIVRTRFYLGGMITAGEYVQAQRARARLRREMAQAFQRVDVLVQPVMTKPAVKFTEYDPVSGFASPGFTPPFNEAGVPAISVPCGFSKGGLRIGMQIAGKPFDEPTVLRAAYTYQQHARLNEKRPPFGQ